MHYRKFLNLQKFFTAAGTSQNRENPLLENKQKFIQLKSLKFCPVPLGNENEKYFSESQPINHLNSQLENQQKLQLKNPSEFQLGEYYHVR